MTESDSSSSVYEQLSQVTESSREAREATAYNIAAAVMYHQVETGDPERFRSAAQWIIENGRTSARTLRLDDDEYLHRKKLEHLEAAKVKVIEARRIESWAGSLYSVKDSPDIIALKSIGVYMDLTLTDIEQHPKAMLDFEDKTAAQSDDIELLRLELAEVSEKLETQTGLETVNVALAVRKMKPRPTSTVTMLDLATAQKEILAEKLANAETELQNRNDVTEALRTGKVSENLRKYILKIDTHAFAVKRPETPYDDMVIEELELGVRAYNILKRMGVRSIGDLLWKTEQELHEMPNMGNNNVEEILEVLAERGLALRSVDDEKPAN